MNEKIKELKRFSLFLFVLGLILTIGGSYAVYRYTYVSTDDNKITSESSSIEFLESNTNVISLENALPMSDTDGKKLDDTFDFVVNTKTSKTLDISYSLVLEKLEPTSGYTQLEDKDVNFYLTDYSGNELVFKNIGDISKDYVIYTKTNSHNSSAKEIKDKYKLRVWLDKDVDVSNWNENTKLEYKFKIGVKTNVGSTDTEETYTVKYNANTGTGNMPSTTFKQGESKKLSKNTFTKEGYVFAGWSTSNNSKKVVYKDEEEVSNLTNVYNGVVNLYAVWVKSGASYQVRYNSNGGTSEILELTTEENHWTYENNVYKSGNYGIEDSVSVIKTSKFTLTETTTISFDWAVSSEKYDYLYYSIYKDGSDTPLDDTGEDMGISGNSGISDESELEYETITKELEPGTYILEFSYMKDESDDAGLDTGYVKNVFIPGVGTLPNSKHVMGTKSKLSKNLYKKMGYVFKGWSTTLNGDVKYSDEEEVIDLTLNEDSIVDLYAVWEKKKYEVNVVVQNGTVDVSSKNVKYEEDVIFNVTSDITDPIGIVTCTNNQYGEFLNNKLTVKNVSDNTTCTVKLSEDVTTLYTDGTFIINEQGKDRTSNMEKHGKVLKEYEPMSSSQTYNFTFDEEEYMSNTLWNDKSASIKRVEIGEVLKPLSTAYWFNRLYYIESSDLSNLDTSMTENMSGMFANTDLKGFSFSELDTSNVSNMSRMFQESFYGINASLDLSNFNMSKVTNTSYMFNAAGISVTGDDTIKGISNWDVSNLKDASYMFWNTNGVQSISSSSFVVDLSNWNTKSLVNASSMFNLSGVHASTWSVGDLSNWNTSSVTDMSSMFGGGYNATTWSVGDLSKWDTSNVTNMGGMFFGSRNATTWSVGDLSNWNTSSVTNMESMFMGAGSNATTWSVGDLSSWDTSQVTDMGRMFYDTGKNATTWSVGDISKWDTSSVTYMGSMFYGAGFNATTFDLDLSNWNTSKVTSMSSMFRGVGRNVTTFNLDLSNWNTSNVEAMDGMFEETGSNATTWTVKIPSTTGNLSNTTSKWYGKTESVYVEPLSGKSFTLS